MMRKNRRDAAQFGATSQESITKSNQKIAARQAQRQKVKDIKF
jgi:hypothetical protein